MKGVPGMSILLSFIVALCGLNPSAAPGVEDVVPIAAGQAQLFVDDFLIATQNELQRTLHSPTKDNGGNVPILEAPEEATYIAYGSIVHDPKLKKYVMLFFQRSKAAHRG